MLIIMGDFDDLLGVIERNEIIPSTQAISFLKGGYRSYFINNYARLHELENEPLHNFILESLDINSSLGYKSDLLDLCVNMDFFHLSVYEFVKSELENRRNYYLKLSCLDYLNKFYFKDAVKADYIAVNLKLNNKTNNNILKFQTNINLMLYDAEKYSKKIIRVLESDDLPPSFCYRFANTIIYNNQFNTLNLIVYVRDLISRIKISERQREDLLIHLNN